MQQTGKPMFSARHYKAIATAISAQQICTDSWAVTALDALITLFKEDNPKFSTEQFVEAMHVYGYNND